MNLIDFNFYVGIAKYAFCAFTVACLVSFLYSFVERAFPNIFLQRAIVTYNPPAYSLPLVALGLLGLVASLIIYVTGASMTGTAMHYGIAALSAVLVQIGAMTYLMSATTEARAGQVLMD